MLSTWISSLNLPSVLSAQPCERKKINLSSSHTEADSWRLVSLSHSHWPNESGITAAWIFLVMEKENPWNSLRNLMICRFIYFSWWLFSIPQYLIHCIKHRRHGLYLKFCLTAPLSSSLFVWAWPLLHPGFLGTCYLLASLALPCSQCLHCPSAPFLSLFALTNSTHLSRFSPPAFPSPV